MVIDGGRGQDWKEERDDEHTCAELIGDSADEAVGLFEAEVNVGLIGDSRSLACALSDSVSCQCDSRCQQDACRLKRL